MALSFRLPDIGEGISEAEVVEWLVAEGDEVAEHQPLLRVETDKALVEIPSPAAGRIGRIRHRSGDTVHVGEVLVSILAAGESDVAAPARTEDSGSVVGALAQEPVELPPRVAPPATSDRPILATPAVRRLARELGVRMEDVHGSGMDGRITEADVREHANGQSLAGEPSPAEDGYGKVERVALHGIRRTIATRLKTAVTHAALATHMDEIDVTELTNHLRTGPGHNGGAGMFAWIVKATAHALRQHPRFNATLDDGHEEVLVKQYVNIGIAVDTPDGLMVPVLRQVEQMPVTEIGAAIERLATTCRARSIDVQALRGGTFSISNIGSLGGMFATPIPNYPQVAILATGRVVERLTRAADGSIVGRMMLPVSVSFDHRVVDGADAARFVNTLRDVLAQPERLG